MKTVTVLVSFLALTGAMQTSAQELVLQTPTGNLYGTLELPSGTGPFPVVLIHPGSGPTDRDGNTTLMAGANNSLKLLAEGLAQNGIASLRIDKRLIGKSQTGQQEGELRFDDLISDAVGWLELLGQDERFSQVFVLGHSEGALVGMVASRQSDVAGFISLAGPGLSLDAKVLEQLRPQLPRELFAEAERVMTELKAGRTVPEAEIQLPPPVISALFRKSVQPYLISQLEYEPAKEIAKLEVPVLIVQGTTDLQVSVKDAELLEQANTAAQRVIIEGMNHVLKTSTSDPQENLATYTNPDLPLAPGLLESIVDFVKNAN